MEPSNSIEAKLEALLPPALSEQGLKDMEAQIDDLAGVQASDSLASVEFPWTSWAWKAVAVIVVLLVAIVMVNQDADVDRDTTVAVVDSEAIFLAQLNQPEMVLLKSTKLVDGRESDGLIVPANGTAPHFRYRYRVVDEEQVRDPMTGTVITLRQPRQEVITIPVTEF